MLGIGRHFMALYKFTCVKSRGPDQGITENATPGRRAVLQSRQGTLDLAYESNREVHLIGLTVHKMFSFIQYTYSQIWF